MKRISILILTISVVLASQSVFAQAQIGIGLKGGWNYAALTGINSVSTATKNKSGYHFGAYMLIKLTKIGIQPEVILSKQGESYSFNGSDYGSNVDYINIPIILKLYLVEGFNLQVGPQFGFVTSATGSVVNQATGAITTGQDIKSLLNTTDFSIGIGAGVDLPFGLNFTARYNMGISDINKYTGGTVPNGIATSMGTQESKNQVFQFSLGYRLFKLGN